MYKRNSNTWLKHIDFMLGDVIMLAAAYFIAWLIRFHGTIPPLQASDFFEWGVVLLVIYIVVAVITKAHKDILKRKVGRELLNIILRVAASFIILLVVTYGLKSSEEIPRLVFVYSSIGSVILMLVFRMLWKLAVNNILSRSGNKSRLIVFCNADDVKDCIQELNVSAQSQYSIAGIAVYDKDMVGEYILGYPVVANAETIKKYVITEVVDEIVMMFQDRKTEDYFIDYFLTAGITVHISMSGLLNKYSVTEIEDLGNNKVITISNNMATSGQLILKRAFDILGGLVGTVITGILYIFIAPQIKAKDPGPALFKQTRIGKNGRHFQIYKFRSMYMDAEARKKELMAQNEMEGFMFKMEDDPRILPGIGHKIRDLSLDEFPQFINVLKGEMSLVGTRPPTLDEYKQYDAHHKARLSFKPGISGLWQVSGRSNITDFEEIVRLDNEYINKWSVWLDVKILLKTVKVVFKKEGSK